MQRTVRLAVTTLLLASLLGAAVVLLNVEQRSARAAALAGDAAARIARMSDTVAAIGTAQQGYVAPGQLDEPWFERASALTSDLSREIQQARARLRSPQAAAALQQLTASVATLTASDARTRENLQLGQELMASDVIFSDGRNLLDAMIASLRDLQAAEHAHLRAELGELGRLRWLTFGTVALWWTVGLLVLVTVRSRVAPSQQEPAQPRVDASRMIELSLRPPPRVGVDLAAAATVCTDLSRITTTSALPGLLGRAAGALDASGLILWISAGEQLFPVMGHGYSQEVLTRMGPIARDAENAAASAWRSGQLTVVPAATGGQGAIVTPLFGLHNCIGVLSAELRQGEEKPEVQAVAAIIAAQLSTVVPAWPAGSLTATGSAPASAARSA
jgi:hypothetical protein